MGLSRKSLKAMGLTEEQQDSIIEMHLETVNGLKEKLTAAEGERDSLQGAQKELDVLRAKQGAETDWKGKYEKAVSDLEKEKKAFSDYKTEQTEKATKAAKESAVKAYFEGKNITGGNLSIAMRGARDEIAGIELDENGKIKDSATLDALIDGEFSALVIKDTPKGANTPTPPGNGGKTKMTVEEIDAITDTTERQKAMLENHELFGF